MESASLDRNQASELLGTIEALLKDNNFKVTAVLSGARQLSTKTQASAPPPYLFPSCFVPSRSQKANPFDMKLLLVRLCKELCRS